MPQIEKLKPKKHLPVAIKTTKKKPKTKPSPVEYYNYCKTKAPALNQQREQELTKLITSYRQTGISLKLLKEVTPGVKPSDLKRKLKRSKSADDITNIPTPPPLPDHLLHDQLKEKQTELESLRTKLATANQELKETKQQLDDSLAARTKALSD
ncbi:5798_t:CDS:2 [Funneliformis geosporum]|uniref:5798_t:CDS:1 n=1 Tax=Funneliformis geosporum TaxID=1117311 RepID=A0A9W4T8N9_9GLOM|nr:5798_t:CDS:2 [Funneliformis geosporum]